jgi:TRAP-type C4-dicarboxylate transport system substrate-binding protein
MLKKTATLMISSAALLALSAEYVPAQAATTLKVSTCLSRNHDYIEAYFDTFFNPLNAKKTDLKLRYLGGPEVTPRKKQASALKRGLIDMIVCPAAYYGGLLSTARMPGLQNQNLEKLKANGAYAMMQESWNKGLNAQILAWVHFKGQKFFIYTRFKPKMNAKTGIDLTGFKMRSTGLYRAFLKAMGATPVNISPGDVYAALERGVVSGLAWPWGSIGKYGWQKFLKYRIEPGFFGATMLTLVNKEKWDSLSQGQRDMLNKQARAYETLSDEIIIKKGHADDKKLKAAGVQIIKLEGALKKAYVDSIYKAKWAENDKLKYNIDYKKLKAKMYVEPGS